MIPRCLRAFQLSRLPLSGYSNRLFYDKESNEFQIRRQSLFKFSDTENQNSNTISSKIFEPSEQIDLLYDSECPICMLEVNFLQKRDINNKIRFTDLSSSKYNPADHGNVGKLHTFMT